MKTIEIKLSANMPMLNVQKKDRTSQSNQSALQEVERNNENLTKVSVLAECEPEQIEFLSRLLSETLMFARKKSQEHIETYEFAKAVQDRY
jgi:hypothetical protein